MTRKLPGILKQTGAATVLLGALLLSACAPAVQPSPIPTAVATAQPTVAPATAQPTTTGQPTTQPTLQPIPSVQPTLQPIATVQPTATTQPIATARPGLAPLLGPEWRILGQGDLYGAGVETVVAYLPSSVVARPQLPPQYVGYGVAAEQIVVVQRNPAGQPWVRLQISLNGLFFNGDNRNAVAMPGVPDTRTIAFAIGMEQQSAPIRVVPIDGAGKPTALGFAARYANGGMVVEPMPDPAAPLQPLVGDDWTIVAQGDLYGTGVETVVAHRSFGMSLPAPQLPPGYNGFTTVVGQLAIVQRNSSGQPWIRVMVSPGAVQLNGDDRNPVFPPGGPNSLTYAFALAVDGPGGPFRLVPLGSDGRPVEYGFSITYDPASRGFALAGLPLPGQEPATVSGRVGFPAGGAPPLEVYAVRVDDPSRFSMVRTELNMPLFSMRLPAGSYYLFAYPADSGAALVGAYSEYVRCGMRIECIDHTLIALTVAPGQNWSDINIGDWYASEGTFPPRPQGQPQQQP